MKQSTDIINSIDRALDILLLLYKEQKEMGISDISRSLDVYKSTVHRTLMTLENKGFVKQNEENGKYWLGIRLYALGMIVGEKIQLKQIVAPYAKELSEKFSEAVNVSVIDPNHAGVPTTLLIHKSEVTSLRLRISPALGSSYPCYSSAVGKCLLAYSEDDLLSAFKDIEFTSFTENTITTYEQLTQEIDRVHKQKYALDAEEEEIGLTCVAAPILNKEGFAVAAISLSGPTTRMKNGVFDEIIESVKETAEKISNLLK